MIIVTLSYGVLILLSIVVFRWILEYFKLRKQLSAIPGPKSLPFIGVTWQFINLPVEERFQWLNDLCRPFKNGMVLLWVGTAPLVMIFKPKYMETVLSSTTLITKAAGYDVVRPWLGDGLITSTGELWFRHRRLITPAFHFNILEEYAAAMRDRVEILLDCLESRLRKDADAPINIFEFAVRYTLDTICETAMGINIDSQRKLDSEYVQALHKFSELSTERIFTFWHKWDALFFRTTKGKECWAAMKVMHNFTEKVIIQKQLERKNKSSEVKTENEIDEFEKRKRKAFLDLLLDQSEKAENPLTFRELREEVDTFMFAGHDTTAAAISWTLFALGNEPEIQDKVYDELKEVFGDDRETASTNQLGQLKYLDRVIKEAARIYPSVPRISRYVDKDIVIDGYLVPKGSDLSLCIYLMHHDPEVWEDPEKFDPDRFLPENIRSKSPYAHIPFSAGPRNCIGQKFAYLELKTALTAILRKWKVSSILKPSEIKMVTNIILRPLNEKIEMYFTPRL